MMNSYWSEQGKYQAEYTRLWNLVPASGKCDVVAGELLRAANRLTYDFYNNGMGNNTSGAVNYLFEMGAISYNTHKEVYYYTRGRTYGGRYEDDDLHNAIIDVMDQTIEFILAHPHLEIEANSNDMFDFGEDDLHFCEECDVELDRYNESGWGHICSDCYSAYDEEEEDEEEECY